MRDGKTKIRAGRVRPGCGGGGGRKPPYTEKNAGMDAGVFFLPFGPRPRAEGCPSPFEPLMKGLRPERVNPTYLSYERGKPGGEGGGGVYAAAIPPPKHAHREGCATLGGLNTLSSPRCFVLRINTTVCGGYAEIEGGRRGGTLRRLFVCLGRP
jgi:hypothetical protein